MSYANKLLNIILDQILHLILNNMMSKAYKALWQTVKLMQDRHHFKISNLKFLKANIMNITVENMHKNKQKD